jgi:phosphoadenosine phosphosulfate reductase
MALIEHDLFGGCINKVAMVIDRLKAFEPPEGYYLAYSGGKDSDTILALAKMAGVKFDAHYHLTTVDPPELVWHVKTHPEVQIDKPKKTMWQIIAENKTLPLRQARFCCRILKENHGEFRMVLTGIRWEESKKRKDRKMTEPCFTGNKTYLHAIIDWKSVNVWEFLKTYNVPYCKLYDEGWKRLGCVCCPNANQRRQAKRWPKIASAYLRAVKRYWPEKQDTKHKTPEAYFQWWLSGKGKIEDGGLFT